MIAPGTSIEIYLALRNDDGLSTTIVSKAKVVSSWPFLDLPGEAFIAATLMRPRLVRRDPEKDR